MEFALDPAMAANAAAQQDITARRREMESLNHTPDQAERRAKLRNACEGFEAIFIQKMWEQMRATLPKDGMMKSKEEEYWQSMYDQELGKSMASSGGIGLADMMMTQLDRNNREMSDATRDSTMRRAHLEVRPAPLLPPSPAQTAPAETAPAAQPAQAASAGTSSAARAPAMSIYDGEAPQPLAPAPDDASPVSAPASGNIAPDASPAMAENTPSSVRQTLDELTALVAAQNRPQPASRAVAQAAADHTDPRHTLQQMTGDAPYHAPRASSAVAPAAVPTAASAPAQVAATRTAAPEAVPEAAPAPIITHITYQTNLPPAQRKAAPSLQRVSAPRQPLSSTASPWGAGAAAPSPATGATGTPGATEAQPGALPAPAAAADPLPPAAPRTSVPEGDILAGIRPRFIPSRFQTRQGMAASAAAAMPAATASQTGGPALRGPEEIVEPVALGNPAPPEGSLSAPVSGDISSGFGWRLDPFTGQRAWHAGVDIKALPGEGVRAAMDGVVTFAGDHPELGHLVVVDHGNGLRTFYGHNQNLEVSAGQRVQAGTELAQAGASGRAAGTHVHFEVRRGELALNPEPLLRQRNLQVAEAR